MEEQLKDLLDTLDSISGCEMNCHTPEWRAVDTIRKILELLVADYCAEKKVPNFLK